MGEIITFYSFKGGVGRTMALANIAVQLAKWDYRVLMIDWDLEAPGLEYYFDRYSTLSVEDIKRQDGIVDLIHSFSGEEFDPEQADVDLSKYVYPIQLSQGDVSLHFMSAGKRDAKYGDRLAKVNWNDFYAQGGGFLIEGIRDQCKQDYDFTLVDSRTGVTDIGGVCTIQLPDILVVMFTAARQSQNGAIQIALETPQARQNIPFDRLSLLSLPILSRFDSDEEHKLSESLGRKLSKALSRVYALWLPSEVDEFEFIKWTTIPYMPYFSFGEKLAFMEEDTVTPQDLRFSYESIASLLATQLRFAEKLVEDRTELVRIASGLVTPESLSIPDEPRPSSSKHQRTERTTQQLVKSWDSSVYHLIVTDRGTDQRSPSRDRYLRVEWMNRPRRTRLVESPLNNEYKSTEGIGRALYACLFDGAIGDGFRDCREKVRSDSDKHSSNLRLILDFWVDPERRDLMINLPWELMHDGDDWLLLDPGLSVVRRVHNPKQEVSQHGTRGIDPPMRVLLVHAEPPDKPPIGVENYFDVTAETMRSAIELLDLGILPHATKEELRSRIRSGVHVLHLLGHGDLELGLFYLNQSESPTSDILTATELQGWIEEAAVTPRLVVLTIGHGNPGSFGILRFAQALLGVGVEAVVSMQTALYTDEARDFTEAFYQGLVQSYWVDDAMRAGRKALHKYRSLRDDEAIISIDPASKKATEKPTGRYHPVSFSTFSNGEETSNVVDLPAWSVPALFLQGAGWMGLELPESPYTWPGDDKEMIYVEEGRFYVDKYPVTREEYRKFALQTGRPIPPWGEVDWEALNRSLANHLTLDVVQHAWEPTLPATNVTVEDAQDYAAWAGKHLPTPEEWQQAALSGCEDKDLRYPWGNEVSNRICNTRERRSSQLWSTLLPEMVSSCSRAGVCDVVGNAAEWTRSVDGHTYVCGGSFKDWGEKCTVQTRRLIKGPNISGGSIGFRCAANLTELMACWNKER